MDDMIDSIEVFFFNDELPLAFEMNDEGRPERDLIVKATPLTLRLGRRVPRAKLMAAANSAARVLGRTAVPMVDRYDYTELIDAYGMGYHDAVDKKEPCPERVFRK